MMSVPCKFKQIGEGAGKARTKLYRDYYYPPCHKNKQVKYKFIILLKVIKKSHQVVKVVHVRGLCLS